MKTKSRSLWHAMWLRLTKARATMKIRVYKGLQQHLGALDPALPRPLPVDLLLFFPFIQAGGVLHTRGLKEPIRVYLLDADYDLVGEALDAPPESAFPLSGNIRHVLETSCSCPLIADFAFLKNQS
jgi:hypothetical protein